jgi:hypothetical protein
MAPSDVTNGQIKGILVNALNGQPLPKLALGLLLIQEEAAGRLGLASYRALKEYGWRTSVKLQ